MDFDMDVVDDGDLWDAVDLSEPPPPEEPEEPRQPRPRPPDPDPELGPLFLPLILAVMFLGFLFTALVLQLGASTPWWAVWLLMAGFTAVYVGLTWFGATWFDRHRRA